jgi:hypothetical protein
MAQPSQSIPDIPTPETPSSEPPRVRRIVCGWNEETNTFLYRDEVTAPPPLVSNGPERVSKRSKTASMKAKLSRGEDVKFSSAQAKPDKLSAKGGARMERRRRERAARRGKVSHDSLHGI